MNHPLGRRSWTTVGSRARNDQRPARSVRPSAFDGPCAANESAAGRCGLRPCDQGFVADLSCGVYDDAVPQRDVGPMALAFWQPQKKRCASRGNVPARCVLQWPKTNESLTCFPPRRRRASDGQQGQKLRRSAKHVDLVGEIMGGSCVGKTGLLPLVSLATACGGGRKQWLRPHPRTDWAVALSRHRRAAAVTLTDLLTKRRQGHARTLLWSAASPGADRRACFHPFDPQRVARPNTCLYMNCRHG